MIVQSNALATQGDTRGVSDEQQHLHQGDGTPAVDPVPTQQQRRGAALVIAREVFPKAGAWKLVDVAHWIVTGSMTVDSPTEIRDEAVAVRGGHALMPSYLGQTEPSPEVTSELLRTGRVISDPAWTGPVPGGLSYVGEDDMVWRDGEPVTRNSERTLMAESVFPQGETGVEEENVSIVSALQRSALAAESHGLDSDG